MQIRPFCQAAKKNGFFEIADRINRECGEQGFDKVESL